VEGKRHRFRPRKLQPSASSGGSRRSIMEEAKKSLNVELTLIPTLINIQIKLILRRYIETVLQL